MNMATSAREQEFLQCDSTQAADVAASFRQQSREFSAWASGYGVIHHNNFTQISVYRLAETLLASGKAPSLSWVFEKLAAADRLTNAAMWLVVHMTYANTVDLSGRPLKAEEFKATPEGHTGGSLNMVPAYVGYLAANLLTGTTRSWIMGQGHCVAAVEAVNTLVGNLSPSQEKHYSRTTKGLTGLVRDFYSYAIGADGRPATPIGSHVNAHTAGGISEGGYLGFAEIEYVHMPLRGESLVAFLSDGAFEEQRGSDWSPRWWRAEDSGFVCPIMILNGRRIEQRTEIAQRGGAEWLRCHLSLSGFDPIDIDGGDPAAFAWTIIETDRRLVRVSEAIRAGQIQYPAPLPYSIAHTVKGHGFPGAGTNRAHNLPLAGSPRNDLEARRLFNDGAGRLWVAPTELGTAIAAFNTHAEQRRPKERDHPLARRQVATPVLPEPDWQNPSSNGSASPMAAIDDYFVRTLAANPHLRPRVGNPDELSSNQMGRTLATLKHRVNGPECGVAEAIDGSVITALNEEAVIGAALGNKGGINLAVSYEAFAVKMLGALRQEIIFARHQIEIGSRPEWIGVPLIATSHTWENGKNEQSHQDPTIGEALLGEMSDVARVLFPVDANTAVEALRRIYHGHGQIGCLIVPKRPVRDVVGAQQIPGLYDQGAAHVVGSPSEAEIQIVAIGAYQLAEALHASNRLTRRDRKVCVTLMVEPGRFRAPRDEFERDFVLTDDAVTALFPSSLPRVVISHTRPEPMTGVLRRIDGGPEQMCVLGFLNRGGTLDMPGMLFANKCTWAHVLKTASGLLGATTSGFLDESELAAIEGHGDPRIVMVPPRL
jgi:phosphoketolase